MNRQTGVTLGGMLSFMLVLILVLYTAARVVPGYMDYWLIKRSLAALVVEPGIQSSSDGDIRLKFAKALSMNNITQADRADLLIERVPDGIQLSVDFSIKRPYMGAISLCLDFHAVASSGKPVPAAN
jgi:hypothetical protein